jgi:hypothetical protein
MGRWGGMRYLIVALLVAALVAGALVYLKTKNSAGEPDAAVAPSSVTISRTAETEPPDEEPASTEETETTDDDSERGITFGVEMGSDDRQPDVTISSDDIGGAKLRANLTDGTAEVSVGDDHLEGLKARIQVDAEGDVSAKAEYKVGF